jgi:hypothetical protein
MSWLLKSQESQKMPYKLIKKFLNIPIEESIPYLFLDESYFKVRTEVAKSNILPQ